VIAIQGVILLVKALISFSHCGLRHAALADNHVFSSQNGPATLDNQTGLDGFTNRAVCNQIHVRLPLSASMPSTDMAQIVRAALRDTDFQLTYC
jgi:hypothetical protein